MLQLAAWVVSFLYSYAGNTPTGQPFPLFFGVGVGLSVLFGTWLLGLVIPRLALNMASGAMVGSALGALINLFTGDFKLIPAAIVCSILCYLAARGGAIRTGQN